MSKPRVIVVTKNVPWPANSGEKQRTLGIVHALQRLGDVTVIGFAGPHDDAQLSVADGVNVRAIPQIRRRVPRIGRQALRQQSITAAKWWDASFASAVDEEVRRGVDVFVVEHAQLADYLPSGLASKTVTLLDMHNIESLLTHRLAKTTRSFRRWLLLLEAVALRRLERRAVHRFDVISVVSGIDRAALNTVVEHTCVEVVPNAISSEISPLPPAQTPTACFVGLLSWAPNADAAVAFTTEVWPAVRAAVPTARLLLVGREPTPSVRALAADDVIVTGTVDDVKPLYGQSQVGLAPLRAGGGSRLKILEALALGRPVLASPIGAEGLGDLVGRGVVLAESPKAMADQLVALFMNPSLCAELGVLGAAAVRADHSWDAATAALVRRMEVLLEAR